MKHLRQRKQGQAGFEADWTGPLDAFDKEKAREIVNAYGQALVLSSELIDSDAEDEGLLPYPKQVIKNAIELLLRDDTDQQRINLLKAGLMYLEDFH